VENVTIKELEQQHAIVYGHFAIALAVSIMYTPYAEQTIAAILYAVLTLPLLLAYTKRHEKTTRAFWIGTSPLIQLWLCF
jgi:Na+-translocating ferredoxin:NAD+ oxidoreductase RnfD subunit